MLITDGDGNNPGRAAHYMREGNNPVRAAYYR